MDMSTDVVVNPPVTPSPAAAPPLPDEPALLKQMIIELLTALQQSQHECDGLRHQIDQLVRRLYGPKAERFDPNQPWLLPEVAPDADQVDPPAEPTVVESEPATSKPARPGHGRKPLPKDLPRRR